MFKTRLRKLRNEKGLRQKDVANIINITTSAYGFYEQGKRDPDTEIIQKLADFFDVSIDYLLCRTDIREPVSKYIDKNNINVEAQKLYTHCTELPPEAHEELESYLDYLKHKYKKKARD